MDGVVNVEKIWDDNPLNIDGSRVINRDVYVNPEIYQGEIVNLFHRTWQWVAHESELSEAGDYISATIAGRPIVVTRGHEGEINAFYNACTHRGAIIAAKAKGNCGGSFTCLYHAWTFGMDGTLEAVPRKEAYGDELKRGCYDIPKVRVDVSAGHIFVNLDGEAPPLSDYLGPVAKYVEESTRGCEVLGRVRWSLDGNWKLWHENFRDNYHPMFAHQVLTMLYQGVKLEGANYDLGGGHSYMMFPPQGTGSSYNKLVSRLTGQAFKAPPAMGTSHQQKEHVIMAVFPNLDFQYGTGNGTNPFSPYCVLEVVRPISVDQAIIEIVAFGFKDEPEETRQARLESILAIQTSAGKVSGDDNEAARRCRIGMGANNVNPWSNMGRGQAPGTTGEKNDEYSLRAFYSEYKKYMKAYLV